MLLVFACAVVGCFALYAHTLSGEAVFADRAFVAKDACHRQLGSRGLEGACAQAPLRTLSFALDHALFGTQVAASRAVNVVLHGIAVGLALLLLWRLLGDSTAAILGAAIFALHPAASEAVATLAGRGMLLTAIFGLLTALAALPSAHDQGRPLALWRRGSALLLYGAAVAAHPVALVLPVVFIALALARRWPGDRGGAWATRHRQTWRQLQSDGHLVVLLVLLLVGAGAALLPLALGHESSTAAAPNLGTAARLQIHLLGQVLWPTALLGDYSFEALRASTSLWELPALGALGALLALVVATMTRVWPRSPLAAASLLGALALLLPSTLGGALESGGLEQLLYLPTLALAAVGAGLVSWGAERLGHPRAFRLVAALLLPLLAMLTVRRAVVFTDRELFWSTTAAQAPRCARAHARLGAIYASQGRLDVARRELALAVKLRPSLCHAHRDLGQVLHQLGKLRSGLACLREALRCSPSVAGYQHLAHRSLRLGLARAAEKHVAAALALTHRAPSEAPVALLSLRAQARHLQGKVDQALADYRSVLKAEPTRWRALLGVGELRALRCELRAAERIAVVLERMGSARRGRVLALRRLIGRQRPRCSKRSAP